MNFFFQINVQTITFGCLFMHVIFSNINAFGNKKHFLCDTCVAVICAFCTH